MKDIVIDSMIVKNFCNPLSVQYKELLSWLKDEGCLAICNYLYSEYCRSTGMSTSPTNICVIIDILTRDGRLNKKTNAEINAFAISKGQERKMRSHGKDRKIVICVLLSDRRFIISKEENVLYDVMNYPGYQCNAKKEPKMIPYKL
jgi:hypothetical protein